jgi:rhodanese-related sulfurtransferase
VRKVLLEAVCVAAIGAALAFAANSFSPRGLKLTRNYFPNDSRSSANSLTIVNHPGGTNLPSASQSLVDKAGGLGLTLVDTPRVLQLFRDPRREQGAVLFVDARDNEHYVAGHIPGAYQLDYYHKEDYLPEVLPRCLAAQEIVVYCTGGACEDSLLTASVLLAPVVPKERLLVYAGGFTEWTNSRLPAEVGPRASGKILNAD